MERDQGGEEQRKGKDSREIGRVGCGGVGRGSAQEGTFA